MMNLSLTPRQKQMLSVLYEYIKSTGYPPTIAEMRERLGVRSNQSILDLLRKLEEKKIIKKNQSGARSIAILPLGYQALGKETLVPFLGISHAGYPIEAISIDGEWRELPGGLAKLEDEVSILKVSGDSMINAGIDDGDKVLVQGQKEFVSGDIVLADVDGESTIKRFISEDKPPYLYLKPENPRHNIIYFTESVTLRGKVVSVLQKGRWRPII